VKFAICFKKVVVVKDSTAHPALHGERMFRHSAPNAGIGRASGNYLFCCVMVSLSCVFALTQRSHPPIVPPGTLGKCQPRPGRLVLDFTRAVRKVGDSLSFGLNAAFHSYAVGADPRKLNFPCHPDSRQTLPRDSAGRGL